MNATLIIAFYNNIAALKLILAALNNQYDNDFDVIIADDGSSDSVVSEIIRIKNNYKFELAHVWHEDKGFRKNKILNAAVQLASNDYLIFIDGDCIPQSKFVRDHLDNAEAGYILNGRRADLASFYSKRITENNPETFFARNFIPMMFSYLFLRQGKNLEKGLRVSNKNLSGFLNRKKKGIVGCNFSVHKNSLIAINGFDERYEAAGVGEDTDIEFRLKGIGLRCKNIFYLANQVHLYHQELPRKKINDDIFNSVVSSGEFYTKWGIKK